jgi:hypothetical protein
MRLRALSLSDISSPGVIVVNASSPYQTFADLFGRFARIPANSALRVPAPARRTTSVSKIETRQRSRFHLCALFRRGDPRSTRCWVIMLQPFSLNMRRCQSI